METKDFQFVVENESKETKYIVDTQFMRLFGLRNDLAEDVRRADANRREKIIATATASKGSVVVQFILDCARVMTALLFLWLVCATLFCLLGFNQLTRPPASPFCPVLPVHLGAGAPGVKCF